MFLLFYYQRWVWIQWSGLLCVNFRIKSQQPQLSSLFFVGNSPTKSLYIPSSLANSLATGPTPHPKSLYIQAHLRIWVHPLSFHHHWMRHELLRFEVMPHSSHKHGDVPNRRDKLGSDHLDQPLLLSPHSSCLFLRLHWCCWKA